MQGANLFLLRNYRITTIEHYDKLIDENNDPVRDPDILKEHMNKWDGQQFIDSLELTNDKTVLEIGIGTGRIAVKVAPYCKTLYGIDMSSKTIDRAKENLVFADNVEYIVGNYLVHKFSKIFDVIYSSLTLLHIEHKQEFFNKAYSELNTGGLFVLSIDNNQDDFIDMGVYKIKVYPDNPDDTENGIIKAGFEINRIIKTEFAHIFVCIK